VKIGSKHKDQAYFHELRGLNTKAEKTQPGPGAVHLPAEAEGDQKQEDIEKIYSESRFFYARIFRNLEKKIQHQSGTNPDYLIDILPRDKYTRGIHPAGVNKKDSYRHQHEHGKKGDKIEFKNGRSAMRSCGFT
jgi:hypothetical protein